MILSEMCMNLTRNMIPLNWGTASQAHFSSEAMEELANFPLSQHKILSASLVSLQVKLKIILSVFLSQFLYKSQMKTVI